MSTASAELCTHSYVCSFIINCRVFISSSDISGTLVTEGSLLTGESRVWVTHCGSPTVGHPQCLNWRNSLNIISSSTLMPSADVCKSSPTLTNGWYRLTPLALELAELLCCLLVIAAYITFQMTFVLFSCCMCSSTCTGMLAQQWSLSCILS